MKKRIIQLIEWILFGVVLSLIVLVGFTKERDIQILGYQLLVVRSESMAPALPLGSLVVTKQVAPTELESDDIVSFIPAETDQRVTHRIVKNDQAQQAIQTKGDNNELPDQNSVSWQEITGKVMLTIPLVGKFLLFLRTSRGLVALVVSLSSLVLLYLLWKTIQKKKKGEINENSAKKIN